MALNARAGGKPVFSLAGLFILVLGSAWTGPARTDADAGKQKAPLPTRWMAGDGTPKPLHAVPASAGPFRMSETELGGRVGAAPALATAVGLGTATRIAVVVEDALYPSIQAKLQRLIGDLQSEGWTVLLDRFVSGTAQSLRTYFRARSREVKKGGLAGALLVGDIPYVIYELNQSWDGTNSEYEDFPCDVFYMDVDGSWSDAKTDGSVQPGNGKYDTRAGDIGLEIWVGRLLAGNLSCLGAEAPVLNNYFEKNHSYRSGKLLTAPGALVYNDDDWSTMAAGDKTNMKKILAGVAAIGAPEGTTAADYKTRRLPANLEFIATRSHGCPGGHGYYRSAKANFESVYCGDYQTIDPKALFYSFFVCSGCDFSALDNLGGVAAFNQQSGLLAYGSTKTGGIWADDLFYDTLAAGGSFGAAFVDWFNKVQTDYPALVAQWWYGMVLIGDASLRPSVWISGTVKTATGAAVAGVTIAFSGSGGTAVTDASGFYRRPVPGGWSGTATPSKAGTSFQPSSRSFTSLKTSKTGQNFKALS